VTRPAPLQCVKCGQPYNPGEHNTADLCNSCAAELLCRIMASSPEPERKTCKVCGAPYSFTEARVLRHARDPKHGDPETPKLCWVCARLRHSANAEASQPPLFF